MMVSWIICVINRRSRLCSFQSTCIRRNSPREYNGIFGRGGGIGCLEGYYMILRMMIWIQLLLPSHWTRTDAYGEWKCDTRCIAMDRSQLAQGYKDESPLMEYLSRERNSMYRWLHMMCKRGPCLALSCSFCWDQNL
jgi:hypothetical protein